MLNFQSEGLSLGDQGGFSCSYPTFTFTKEARSALASFIMGFFPWWKGFL